MNRATAGDPARPAATFHQGTVAEGAMAGFWDLPISLRLPVERALADSEANFREILRAEGARTWPKLRLAIDAVMLASFEAFANRVCLAVQQNALTVLKARAEAESFLQVRATQIHDWLAALLDGESVLSCQYRFGRYDSEDRFVFCRDMTDAVQASEHWSQFLKDLAATDAGNVGDDADKLGDSVSDELKRWRRDKLKEIRDNTGMSVEKMGEKIGMSSRTIQAIAAEDGTRFKRHQQAKLLELIKVSLEDWYRGPA
jgi:DNA-binding XRE family transcriptional regulator